MSLIFLNWSGGKDSAMALYHLQQSGHNVMCLLTSFSEPYDRVSMHGVRRELLEMQAERIGLPLVKMMVPDMPSMESYEAAMRETLLGLKAQGATVSAFGDIFLEDLRKYREEKLAGLGLTASFPLWKRPTDALVREFLELGFKTIVTCVDEKCLDRSFAGRIIDEQFLNDLPPGVDPCGENGEFHTFVFDGPVFSSPVPFTIGETVYRRYNASASEEIHTGFWYTDLLVG